MTGAELEAVRKVFNRFRSSESGDGELLTRYRVYRDQAAFGSLVRRHGPMVLGVCRRLLRDRHAAEDAFQATFVVLSRKADTVWPPDRLAPWLYGVAYRTALKARSRAFRRSRVEAAYAAELVGRVPPASDAELLSVIDEQLNALPEKYRHPLILCAIQGLNKAEAATRLGLPEGTVSSRLARARDMLRDRLARRGIVIPTVTLGALLTADTLQAAVPPTLAATASGAAGSALVSPTVFTLANEVLRSMTLFKLNTAGVVVVSAILTGGTFGLYAVRADENRPQPNLVEKSNPADVPSQPKADAKYIGTVGNVDADTRTITVLDKGPPSKETVVKLPVGAKVFVDGRETKLDDVPKGSLAWIVNDNAGAVAELWLTGSTTTGVIKQVDKSSITLGAERIEKTTIQTSPGRVIVSSTVMNRGGKGDRVIRLAVDGKVLMDGKVAKLSDLRPGDHVTVTMTADGLAAATISVRPRPTNDKRPVDNTDQEETNEGEPIKPGDKPVKPGEKPVRPAFQHSGKVASVDAKANTLMIAVKGDGGIVEKRYPVAPDAKVFIDGKEAKLADVPRNSTAMFTTSAKKDGELPTITELHIAGPTIRGTIKTVDAATIALESEKKPQEFKITADTKVIINGKDAKIADLKVGDRVILQLRSDDSAVLTITSGSKTGDGEKPSKTQRFSGKVASVDTTARTVTIMGKTENGHEIVVQLTADAKIIVDGVQAKIGDIQKGMVATFTLVATKDGQLRQASEVIVNGPTLGGSIKQINANSITVANEKIDRVIKLTPATKVIVNGKDAKISDLKVGDRVVVTLNGEQTSAVQITSGANKPGGDGERPPKPEKEEDLR